MSSVVVDTCVYHRLHVDYGRYLSAQGLAHRQHKHGRSMSTSGEIALEIALRLQNHMKIARVREGYNSGQVARNTFFTKHCKVRLAKDGNHVTGGYVGGPDVVFMEKEGRNVAKE